MAEVIIGVVASGITIGALAARITSSIIKIKGYWDQIHNAPEDVQDLIEELEMVNGFLTVIEDEQRQNQMPSLIWNSNSMSRCLQYCKQAAERLKDVAETLSVELEARKKMPRKLASFKVVLKKDKVDRHRAQLARAVKLLSFSYQLYTSTLLRVQTDVLVAKLSHSMVPIPQLGTEGASDHQQTSQSDTRPATRSATITRSDQYWNSSLILGNLVYSRTRCSITKGKTRDVAGRKKEVEVILAQYRSPSWFVNKLWHIQAVKASRGWDFSPRAYNVVHERSPVFGYAVQNDVRGLQELFSERNASPFDCNDDGWTPLMVAAGCGSFEVCDLLIKEGADPNYLISDAINCYTALHMAMAVPRKNSEEFPRLLFNETEFTPSLSKYRGSAKGFVLWQEALDPMYYQRPLEVRFQIAKSVALGKKSEAFKTALDRDSILRPLTKENCETLHVIAGSIILICADVLDDPSVSNHETCRADLQGWLSVLRDVIAMNYCLHHVSSIFRTPLLDLVQSFIINLAYKQEVQLSELLEVWLECLQTCGVDLQEYGREETRLHQQGLVFWYYLPMPTTAWHITSFEYGSSPSDWRIDIEPLDGSDTETPSNMPGGWIEDDDPGGKANRVEVEGE